MSDVIKLSRVLPSAIKFNAKLQLQIPEAVLQLYPKLRAAYNSPEFAHAVADVQAHLGLEQDGFFGPATQQALTQSVMPDADFLVIKGAACGDQHGGAVHHYGLHGEPEV